MYCIHDSLYAKTRRSVRKINLRYSLKYTRMYTSAKNSTFECYNPPSTYYEDLASEKWSFGHSGQGITAAFQSFLRKFLMTPIFLIIHAQNALLVDSIFLPNHLLNIHTKSIVTFNEAKKMGF